MKSALCFLLLSGVMTGQPLSLDPRTLSGILQALEDNRESSSVQSDRLVGAMLALSDPVHPPSRQAVADFADPLARAQIGRSLTETHVTVLLRFIALTADRVDSSKAQEIIKCYIAIGEEVRGPDDLRAPPRLKK